jgi:hypothetical protein
MMKLTETQWARIGVATLAGLLAAIVLLLVLYAPRVMGYEPVLAILGGISIGIGLYIYDSRTESTEQ